VGDRQLVAAGELEAGGQLAGALGQAADVRDVLGILDQAVVGLLVVLLGVLVRGSGRRLTLPSLEPSAASSR